MLSHRQGTGLVPGGRGIEAGEWRDIVQPLAIDCCWESVCLFVCSFFFKSEMLNMNIQDVHSSNSKVKNNPNLQQSEAN